jgi:hypothetical protein
VVISEIKGCYGSVVAGLHGGASMTAQVQLIIENLVPASGTVLGNCKLLQ